MKRLILIFTILSISSISAISREYEVYGPQGGLAMKITLPQDFDTATQKCPMVILMHGMCCTGFFVHGKPQGGGQFSLDKTGAFCKINVSK